MPTPIQQEHELLCPNCGCVLAENVYEQNVQTEKPVIPYSTINFHFLGSALDGTKRDPKQVHQERTARLLEQVCKKYGLPDKFVLETFNVLKKKNRGFYSQREPIKQLLKILEKDDNYEFIYKYRALKKRYEQENNC